jgi:hypothetical protein
MKAIPKHNENRSAFPTYENVMPNVIQHIARKITYKMTPALSLHTTSWSSLVRILVFIDDDNQSLNQA